MTSSKIWGFQTPLLPIRHLLSRLSDPLDDVIFHQPPPFPKMIFGKIVVHDKIEK